MRLIAFLLLVICAGSVYAGDDGWYVGGGAGTFHLGANLIPSRTSGAAAGGYLLGGYQACDTVGLELRVGETASVEASPRDAIPLPSPFQGTLSAVETVNLQATSFLSLLGRFRTPEIHGLRAFGLLGATSARSGPLLDIVTFQQIPGGVGVPGFKVDDRATCVGLTFGGGLELRVSEFGILAVEYVRYWDDVATAPGIKTTIDSADVSLRVRL